MCSTRSRINFSTHLIVTCLVGFCTLTAQAQTEQPIPGPEHKKLATRVGKWNYQGEGQASPFGPAGKFAGVTTFRMVLNGFFLEERWEDKSETSYVAEGITLTGYDPVKKSFVDYAFENDGHVSPGVVTVQGNTWTSTGERTDRQGKTYKTKWMSMDSEDDMTSSSKVDYSADDGKTWLPFFELTATKVND